MTASWPSSGATRRDPAGNRTGCPAPLRQRCRSPAWTHTVLDPDHVEATVDHLATGNQASLVEDNRRQATRSRIADAQQRLEQFKAALTRGANPGVVSTWINEAQADLARARTDLALPNDEVPTELSPSDLTTVVLDICPAQRLADDDTGRQRRRLP